MYNSISKSDDNNISYLEENFTLPDTIPDIIPDVIANNVPPGLTELCGNLQTILIATFVPTIVNVIVSITNNKENNLATYILIITLIIISISLILFSNFIYTTSKRNINKYFIWLYICYFMFGCFALFKSIEGADILDVFNIQRTYIKTSVTLLRLILGTLILSTFLFSIFNINYELYANK
jgi:type III secretory pathway component EscS